MNCKMGGKRVFFLRKRIVREISMREDVVNGIKFLLSGDDFVLENVEMDIKMVVRVGLIFWVLNSEWIFDVFLLLKLLF